MDLYIRDHFVLSMLILLTLATCSHGIAQPIKIGAIFHKGDEEYMSAFKKAISETRRSPLAPAFKLIPVIKYIDSDTDSFKTGIAVCEVLEKGVAAIFGPPSAYTRGIVASTAIRYEIPYIDYVWRENEVDQIANDPLSMTINVFPDSEIISQAIATVVQSTGWKSFMVIYEDNDGLSRIQKSLTLKQDKERLPITIRQLGEGPDYRSVLKEIHSLRINNIIIDVKPQKLIDVLYQAKEVKLFGDCDFIITYLDSTKLPIFEVRNGTGANITGFSLRENDDDIEGINLIESAVLYDAVFLLHKALETLNARNIGNKESIFIEPTPLFCDRDEKYEAGANITNIMREVSKMGKITGMINFDEYGRRRDFNLRILNFQEAKPVQTAFWTTDGLTFTRNEEEMETYLYKSIKEKKFKITTREGPPYVMQVSDGSRGIAIEGKFYEGYCIDLIDHIAKKLEFKYEFELVPDTEYGKYDSKTKTWNGLIRRLLDRKADLAICDLTINHQRGTAVDFTTPFMNLGISILYSKPEDEEQNLFSFLSPLSKDVWLYMATAFLAVSIMLFLQARMAPGEWTNPHPCNADPEELENSFNLKNSMWLTIGSLMQQGSDILPRTPSIRMLTSMWWFFTLIMISSYTANLAAFLTSGKMETPIKNVEDLAKQTAIKYGAVKGGATAAFFENSNYTTYKRMWTAMSEWRPSVFMSGNPEGVERVVKSKRTYAFLMESTSIEFLMQRNCEIDQIGGLIDSKGYGIALQRNSVYRTPINRAILELGEKGTLQALKKKWWEEMGGGLCRDESEKSASTNELGMKNVGGVFLVLMCGCAFAFIIAICEFLWNVRQIAVTQKITPWEALVAELKFVLNIWATTKPVKIAKSSSEASSMEGGFNRAASTARSIVGSFLRLDMLDRFEKDRNTNNRKNDHKIN